MQTNFLFPLIFVIGAITSLEDHKIGKIRNIWILSGLFLGAAFYLSLFFFETVRYDLLFRNFFISILVSYTLWKTKFWNPGDAKLFIIYAFLTPPYIYNAVYFYSFPAFNLLVNIFVPALTFLIIVSLKDIIINGTSGFLDEAFGKYMKKEAYSHRREHLKKFAKNLFVFFCIFLLRRVLSEKLTSMFLLNNKTLFLLLFFIYRPIAKLLTSKGLIIITGILIVTLLVHKIFFSPIEAVLAIFGSLKMALILIFIWNTFSLIFEYHIKHSKEESMPFAGWMFFGVLVTWFFPVFFLNLYKALFGFN